MTLFLKQSTSIKIRMGPYMDLTDAVTPETGLSIGAADEAEVLKANGAATVAMTGAFAAVSGAAGWYDYTVATGDVDTVGEVVFVLQDASVTRPVPTRGYVLEEAVYDAWFGASATPLADIADAVWDEELTGSSHNIATSAGKRLRQVEEGFIHADGTIAAVTDGHTFTLDSGAVATTDYYVGDRLDIVEGTGAGQSRLISGYTSGKVVTLDSDFATNPNTASLYEIVAADVHVSLSDSDLASGFVTTATSTTTITLNAGAVATTDYYVGQQIVFTHGTGAGQAREITGYTSGRVVTMSPALKTAVSTDTVWHIQAIVSIPELVDQVLNEATSGHSTAGTVGKAIADGTFSSILTTQMTESYAADGAAPTLAQALMMIQQMLGDFAISGTTLTVRKVDGATAAATFTLDSASAPTSLTRAT